jgi:tetratricopeptide (TPR) repeat protein
MYKILILIFLLFSCKGKKESGYENIDMNSQLIEVTNYQEKNDFQNANNLLESLIKKSPNNAELFFRLAHSKTISDPNLFEIMNLLEQCLTIDSSHYKALYLKSQGLMFMGNFKGALEIENKLLDKFPDSFNLKTDIASTLLFNADFEGAIKLAETILPESKNIYETERLIRVQIYANYFLDKIEEVKIGKNKLQQLGFETDYLEKLINSKEMKFESFAIGKNVGNKPCSIDQLEFMFPEK